MCLELTRQVLYCLGRFFASEKKTVSTPDDIPGFEESSRAFNEKENILF